MIRVTIVRSVIMTTLIVGVFAGITLGLDRLGIVSETNILVELGKHMFIVTCGLWFLMLGVLLEYPTGWSVLAARIAFIVGGVGILIAYTLLGVLLLTGIL